MTWSGDPEETAPEPPPKPFWKTPGEVNVSQDEIEEWRQKFRQEWRKHGGRPQAVFYDYGQVQLPNGEWVWDGGSSNVPMPTPGLPAEYTIRQYGQMMCYMCLLNACEDFHSHPGDNDEIPAITMVNGTAMCKACARHDAAI